MLTLITSLILTGNLNGNDIRYIRELAERNVMGQKTYGKPEYLNISKCRIKESGYYHDCCTSLNDIINEYMFYKCRFRNILLPDKTYEIRHNSFKDCTEFVSITIPQRTVHIECNAFRGCTGLSEIHCMSEKPLTIDPYVFENVNKNTCRLFVPKGSMHKYWIAPVWGSFQNIIEE